MGRKYIFTNKKESKKGIMSAVLGIIALVSLFFAVYETFRNQGQALVKYGVAALFALLFALAGICLLYTSKAFLTAQRLSGGCEGRVGKREDTLCYF